ncbi:Crp/Fnr family transcriptional regulator [Halovibrio salipaludis]|uniref:Crp/Fnr family transcriptional regulator n=2 Tax=Halovibrio salipaludis TaxID=2032626 RepID=A0A2A2FD16_9GAMM|nr:Crp/Fnr family transcriptional regulator [Halovibrio salipaludis]
MNDCMSDDIQTLAREDNERCQNPGSGMALLGQHPLFNGLSRRDFEDLGESIRLVKLRRGQVLYKQDSPAYEFFYVVSGRLRLYRLDTTGQERTLDSHGPGEVFADVMIYADPARYVAYAEPLRRTELLAIPTDRFRAILERNPAYSQLLLRQYASRMVQRFRDLEVMTVRRGVQRVMRYLLEFVPDNQRYNIEVELPLPQNQIATRLAMQPETLSRLMRDMAEEGVFELRRGRLFIPDRQALEERCL